MNPYRYEIRYLKQINKQFNKSSILASDLWDNSFYSDLKERWQKEYLKIIKQPVINYSMDDVTTKEDFKKFLSAISINNLGYNEIFKKIEELQNKKTLSRMQAKTFRDYTKECCDFQLLHSKNELIEELDNKIKESVISWC